MKSLRGFALWEKNLIKKVAVIGRVGLKRFEVENI